MRTEGAPTCAGVAVCCGVMCGSTMCCRGCAHVALVRIASSPAPSPRGDMWVVKLSPPGFEYKTEKEVFGTAPG